MKSRDKFYILLHKGQKTLLKIGVASNVDRLLSYHQNLNPSISLLYSTSLIKATKFEKTFRLKYMPVYNDWYDPILLDTIYKEIEEWERINLKECLYLV